MSPTPLRRGAAGVGRDGDRASAGQPVGVDGGGDAGGVGRLTRTVGRALDRRLAHLDVVEEDPSDVDRAEQDQQHERHEIANSTSPDPRSRPFGSSPAHRRSPRTSRPLIRASPTPTPVSVERTQPEELLRHRLERNDASTTSVLPEVQPPMQVTVASAFFSPGRGFVVCVSGFQ